MSSSRSVSLNIGPFGFLPVMVFIVFLTLKLGGWGVVATWSWLWVCSPLWIGLALVLCFFVLFLLFALIVGLLKAIFS
jgi:hypothetical protein